MDDKLHGVCKSYYYNGTKKSIAIYNYGICLERTIYYSTGELYMTQKFIDDITEEFIQYYKNEKIQETHLIINKKKNGIEKIFYDTGNLKEFYINKDGRHHGIGELYYLDGITVKTRIEYENGEKISSTEFPCYCQCHNMCASVCDSNYECS